jgi:hypothetical protein
MPSHLFYEVRDKEGAIWGGEDPLQAVAFWRNHPRSTVWVSEWEGEGEDLHQTTKAINITRINLATKMETLETVGKML